MSFEIWIFNVVLIMSMFPQMKFMLLSSYTSFSDCYIFPHCFNNNRNPIKNQLLCNFFVLNKCNIKCLNCFKFDHFQNKLFARSIWRFINLQKSCVRIVPLVIKLLWKMTICTMSYLSQYHVLLLLTRRPWTTMPCELSFMLNYC